MTDQRWGFTEGVPNLVMVICTFGDCAWYYAHRYAIVAEGFFERTEHSMFCRNLTPSTWRKCCGAKVFSPLRREGKMDDRQIRKLIGQRQSGSSVYRGNRMAPDDRSLGKNIPL